MNLSNMENLDMVTGRAYAKVNGIDGPVINSQRQLWSVAGYMSMVQDIVFGLDTNDKGIRFQPVITAGMHRKYFKDADKLTLSNFSYRGKTINCNRTPAGYFKYRRYLPDQKNNAQR